MKIHSNCLNSNAYFVTYPSYEELKLFRFGLSDWSYRMVVLACQKDFEVAVAAAKEKDAMQKAAQKAKTADLLARIKAFRREPAGLLCREDFRRLFD